MLSHHSHQGMDGIGTMHHTVTQTTKAGQKQWNKTVQSHWHEFRGIKAFNSCNAVEDYVCFAGTHAGLHPARAKHEAHLQSSI